MLIQLQFQRSHGVEDKSRYRSMPLTGLAPGEGVTTEQAIAALALLKDEVIGRQERMQAEGAFARAVEWVLQRPPARIPSPFSRSFPFDPTDPGVGYRFDITSRSGQNLMG
jgi:hypothetical protein